ncbi:MAG: PIG-L family deacetylase, partial [Oscillospiraceae bacterium]
CEITLFTEGELPKYVQQWQPPLDDSDILFLPTHADDEHLFFGSALSYYSIDTDKKVQVAYLTNHYGEWYRPHELLAGLWEVGVKNYPIIPEFKDMYSESLDNAKTLYDTDAMLEYQVELIRRFRPEVIVEHDENGEYGHGVHRLNAYLLKQSLELSNDATAYPQSARKFGVFDVPKAYFHLYGDTILDVDKIMCDGRTPLQATIDGFDHHKSQHQYFKVEKGGKYDFAKFGLYRSLVGEDVQKNDLFENIQVYSDKVLPPTSSENMVSSDVSSNSESTIEVIGNTSSNISSDSTSSVPEGSVKHFFDVVKNINFISLAFILTGVLIIIITLKNHNKKEDAMVKYYMDRRK